MTCVFSVVTSKFIRSSKLPSAAFPITVIRFLTFTNTENKICQLVFFHGYHFYHHSFKKH